jgi:predicted nucleotidyltransferase
MERFNLPIQEVYLRPINELVGKCRELFKDNIHSIYVYGSVAKQKAQPFISNVDLLLVARKNFSDDKYRALGDISQELVSTYPFCTEFSISTLLITDLTAEQGRSGWEFVIRDCALCIYGDDLSDGFDQISLTNKLYQFWNYDIETAILYYREQIALSETEPDQIKHQRLLAKKMLRAFYGLLFGVVTTWEDDPEVCAEVFRQYAPKELHIHIDRLLILYKGFLINKRSVLGLIDLVGPWLVNESNAFVASEQ